MKFLDEFRDPKLAKCLVEAIQKHTTRPWNIMEVCGGQTHAILRFGIDQMLPSQMKLLHGPGCPVCVTPAETLDRAFEIASEPHVIFCTFGSMLRVPGNSQKRSHDATGSERIFEPFVFLSIRFRSPRKTRKSRLFFLLSDLKQQHRQMHFLLKQLVRWGFKIFHFLCLTFSCHPLLK